MYIEIVDRLAETMRRNGDDLALLGTEIWEGFLRESRMKPEPFGNDWVIAYKGIEFRPSIAP